MKRKNFPLLAAALLLMSGCEKKPSEPEKLNITEQVTTVQTASAVAVINDNDEDNMTDIKPSSDMLYNTSSSQSEDRSEFSYQLPDICKDIEWEYKNAVCEISFEHSDIDEVKETIPPEILTLAKEKMQNDPEPESGQNEPAYIDYFIYDINDDGIPDYFIKALPGSENYHWKSFLNISSGLYVSSENGYFTVDCDLNFKHISLLETKTNGLHDILTGYFGNDICKYNGIDAYSPELLNSSYGGSSYELTDNETVKISLLLDIRYPLEDDKRYYAVMLPEENDFLCHDILYASDEKGEPIIFNSDMDINHLDFYSEIKSDKLHDIWFKQIKFVPIEPEQNETENILAENQAENQIEYTDSNINVLMEFTSAEELSYYPKVVKLSYYREDQYVLHANFQVTNLSGKSFDFIPQKMVIHGRHQDKSGSMIPITSSDLGLIASDKYYTIEPGDTVSFPVDFVGNKICLEYAYELDCNTAGFRDGYNIDAKELNNVHAGEFSYTKRIPIKKAINAAFNKDPNTYEKLIPREGEYSVNTPKNSYCFTVQALEGGDYIKIALRLQSLTGKPEKFEPRRFRLHLTGQKTNTPDAWDIDTLLVGTDPDISDMKIEGVNETLYKSPFDLSIRADGSAEYTMYFYSMNYDPEDYYMFSYDGDNDVFECMINIE